METSKPVVVTHPGADLGRTERYFFRRRVRYAGGEALLRVYADTRYRLFVGGRLVTTGPVRSVPGVRAMFDTVDLGRWLEVGGGGEQWVVVEVLCQRANNFQAMPGTPGGFAAFGRIGGVGGESVETGVDGGGWEVKKDEGWGYPTPHYSFAQGPTEVCDVRLRDGDATKGEGSGWVVPVEVESSAYAGFAPADLPLPAMVEEGFATGVDLGVSVAREVRVMATVAVPGGRAGAEAFREGPRPKFAWATFVHSPRAQTVELGIFWGPNSLNGVGLKQTNDGLRGNRQNAVAELREGWNLLFGVPEFMGPVWGVMVGAPQEAGLTFRAEPEMGCGDSMRVSELLGSEEMGRVLGGEKHPEDLAGVEKLALKWERVKVGAAGCLPAREVAWDRYEPAVAEGFDPRKARSRVLRAGEVWSVVADFGTEYLGLHTVTVTVPGDTTVDFAYEERTRGDGAVDLFSSNPFCDMAERFVLPAGRHRLQPCQPRGGRVAQLTFRMAVRGSGGEVRVEGWHVVDVKRVVTSVGAMTSGSTLLAWAYNTSRHTIERTLEDGYVDPWRERGLYLGDAYVAGLSHLCLTPEVGHVRHALRLFADGQREDGQYPCVVPAYLRDPHEDFSLVFVDFLRRYVRETGDVETGAYVWPSVGRMFGGSRWKRGASGLWDTDEGRVFLDWGVHAPLRNARENGCINALRYMALEAAGELALMLGRPGEERRLLAEAGEVKRVYNERLWLGEEEGYSPGFAPGAGGEGKVAAFAPARRKDEPALPAEGTMLREHNVHVNLLALFSGVVREDRVGALLGVVERQMAVNPGKCRDNAPHSGMAELYFLRFATEGLCRFGRTDLALKTLLQHFSILRELKLVTLPEAIHRAVMNKDSLCHCWGGWPVEFVARRLVGVGLERANDTSRVRVAPSEVCPLPMTLTCPVGRGLVQVSLGEKESRVVLTNLAGGVYVRAGGRREELRAGVNVVGR